MNSTSRLAKPTELQRRLRSVSPPGVVLDRAREERLTQRQRQILDHLGELFEGGFAHLTMAEIAARSNCSLRTLYGLAPSRDELVLTVVDRHLWRVGRHAMDAMRPHMEPLSALQAYLYAVTAAVNGTTEAFSRDLAASAGTQRLGDGHTDYSIAVTRCLLDLAAERGDIAPVDTAAAARVMVNLARDFARPEVMTSLESTPKQAADSIVAMMLRGMRFDVVAR